MSKKIIFFVVLGNILEYYDFLLFAHLGFIITPLYFPDLSSKQTHILSLLLFGLSFLIRPLGGFIFGRMSDLYGRKTALVQSTKWAIIPALALSFLPSYEIIGVIATYLFVAFRILQGIALGGEYPTAGTYLMEYHSKNKGFMSGLVCASGTIGSLFGFGIAFICIQEWGPSWLWRAAFFLGAMGGIYNFHMRKVLLEQNHYLDIRQKSLNFIANRTKILLVIAIGMLVGLTTWIPMTYSNFYLTKIQGMAPNEGLLATFIALVSFIIFTPFFGYISDKFLHYTFMMMVAFLIVPLSILSFSLLIGGHIILAQIGLIIAAAGFGAPIHVVMNAIFPATNRGRFVSLFFMIGLSLGGLAPSLSGYIVDQTNFHYTPAFLLSFVALITGIIFYKTKSLSIDSESLLTGFSEANKAYIAA